MDAGYEYVGYYGDDTTQMMTRVMDTLDHKVWPGADPSDDGLKSIGEIRQTFRQASHDDLQQQQREKQRRYEDALKLQQQQMMRELPTRKVVVTKVVPGSTPAYHPSQRTGWRKPACDCAPPPDPGWTPKILLKGGADSPTPHQVAAQTAQVYQQGDERRAQPDNQRAHSAQRSAPEQLPPIPPPPPQASPVPRSDGGHRSHHPRTASGADESGQRPTMTPFGGSRSQREAAPAGHNYETEERRHVDTRRPPWVGSLRSSGNIKNWEIAVGETIVPGGVESQDASQHQATQSATYQGRRPASEPRRGEQSSRQESARQHADNYLGDPGQDYGNRPQAQTYPGRRHTTSRESSNQRGTEYQQEPARPQAENYQADPGQDYGNRPQTYPGRGQATEPRESSSQIGTEYQPTRQPPQAYQDDLSQNYGPKPDKYDGEAPGRSFGDYKGAQFDEAPYQQPAGHPQPRQGDTRPVQQSPRRPPEDEPKSLEFGQHYGLKQPPQNVPLDQEERQPYDVQPRVDVDEAPRRGRVYNNPAGLYGGGGGTTRAGSNTRDGSGRGGTPRRPPGEQSEVTLTGPDGKKYFNRSRSDVYALLREEEDTKKSRAQAAQKQAAQSQPPRERSRPEHPAGEEYRPSPGPPHQMAYLGYGDPMQRSPTMKALEKYITDF